MAKYSTHGFNQSLIKLPSSRNKPWLFASFKSAFFNPSKMLCEKKLIDCTTATCVFIRAQFLTSIILSLLNKSVKNHCLLNPVYCRIIGHGFHQNCLLNIPFHIQIHIQIFQIGLHTFPKNQRDNFIAGQSICSQFDHQFIGLGMDIIRRKLMLVTINSSRTHLVEMTESVEAQQRLVKGIFRKFTGMKTERFPHVFLIEVKISLIKLIRKSLYAQ